MANKVSAGAMFKVAPPPPAEPPVVDVSIVEVKPKYFLDEMAVIEQKISMIKKFGAKPLGHFFTQGGEFGEIIHIVEWANMGARKQGMQTMMKDPEFHALHKATSKHIRGGRSYICKESPLFKMQTIKPGPIFMENLCCKKFPAYCIQKFARLHARIEGPGCPQILGVLHPLLGPGNGVILFADMPNGSPDEFFAYWHKLFTNANMWPELADFHDYMSPTERRILVPLSELPK